MSLSKLTPREKEAVVLLVRALPQAEIAAAMGTSRRTTALHLSHARDKLGCETNLQLAIKIIRFTDAAGGG